MADTVVRVYRGDDPLLLDEIVKANRPAWRLTDLPALVTFRAVLKLENLLHSPACWKGEKTCLV